MGRMTIGDLLEANPMLVRGSDESLAYTKIPFGIDVLDKLTGGGIPRKRISIFTGPTNSGKSFLASQVLRSVQKMGGIGAWEDVELSWDRDWMGRCGVDVDNVLVHQPFTAEEAFDNMKSLMIQGVDLIVLDSIAGLVPSNVQNENFGYNPMAWQARFVNTSLPRLLPHLKLGTVLIAINQIRSSIGPSVFDNMPGGMAQAYYAHFILEIRRGGWIKDGDVRVGFDMEIRCKKSKVGGNVYGSCTVPFRLDGGFDVLEMALKDAISCGMITKSGVWYKYDGQNFAGMSGLRAFFENDRDKMSMLMSMVRDVKGMVMQGCDRPEVKEQDA